MCVRVHFDFCCHRARAQLRANVLSFFLFVNAFASIWDVKVSIAIPADP